jgi:hypothetical protein
VFFSFLATKGLKFHSITLFRHQVIQLVNKSNVHDKILSADETLNLVRLFVSLVIKAVIPSLDQEN